MERQGNQEEKLLNAEISNLIGKRLHDFDLMGAEVSDLQSMICLIQSELSAHPSQTTGCDLNELGHTYWCIQT